MSDQSTCLHCDRRATAPPALLCPACATRLDKTLAELATAYPRLDARPGATGAHSGARGTPGFGSRSPARVDVLSLTDGRRSAAPEQHENAGVPAVVAWWADRCREDGLLPLRRVRADVPSECEAIRKVLGAVVCRWWVAELVAGVEQALWRVRHALGELEPTVPLGGCPILPEDVAPLWTLAYHDLSPRLARMVCDGLLAEHGCGGQVRARAFGETARCQACGMRWDTRAELRLLGEQLGDALLDLPGLARYLDVPVSTLTTWAQRDDWEKLGARKRRLYRLVDARASFARRRLGVGSVAA